MTMIWVFVGAGCVLALAYIAWCCDHNDDQYRF